MENYQLLPCAHCGGKAHHLITTRTDNWIACDGCGASTAHFWEANRAFSAWNTRASGWVSVADEVPMKLENVLIFRENTGTSIGQYSPSFEKWYEVGLGAVKDVTHWQPLPQPPKPN